MRVLTAAGLLVLAVTAVRAQQPQQPTFRAGTSIVPILATVLDTGGRLVPDLERTDFTILDNGKPQEILSFQNSVEPFTVVVTLDFSYSMNNNLALLKSAAEQFFLRMLPADKARVGSFSDKIMFSPGAFTSDRDDLIMALKDLQYGNDTRLYDAIDTSMDLLDEVKGRKVVLVFTDGDDTASRRDFGDVLAKARDKEVMIYAIGLQAEFNSLNRVIRTRPPSSLRRLADETGGGYFELKKTTELAPTFTRVVQELHSLYALGFAPANLDGKEHKLEVRVKPGMTARARRTYIASPDRLAPSN